MNAQALLDAIGASDREVMDLRGKDAMNRAMSIAISAVQAAVHDLAHRANNKPSSFEISPSEHFAAICERVRTTVAQFNLVTNPVIGEATRIGSEAVLAAVHELLTEPPPRR